jgi:hypothetical protein
MLLSIFGMLEKRDGVEKKCANWQGQEKAVHW